MQKTLDPPIYTLQCLTFGLRYFLVRVVWKWRQVSLESNENETFDSTGKMGILKGTPAKHQLGLQKTCSVKGIEKGGAPPSPPPLNAAFFFLSLFCVH